MMTERIYTPAEMREVARINEWHTTSAAMLRQGADAVARWENLNAEVLAGLQTHTQRWERLKTWLTANEPYSKNTVAEMVRLEREP
jgi:hypothetical protein